MKKLFPVFLMVLLLVPLTALAVTTQIEVTICQILQVIKNIVAAIGLAIAIILLIVSGIKYMTSGGDADKATKARQGIINALIGVVIVIGALFIIALAQNLLTSAGAISFIGDPCAGYVVP